MSRKIGRVETLNAFLEVDCYWDGRLKQPAVQLTFPTHVDFLQFTLPQLRELRALLIAALETPE